MYALSVFFKSSFLSSVAVLPVYLKLSGMIKWNSVRLKHQCSDHFLEIKIFEDRLHLKLFWKFICSWFIRIFTIYSKKSTRRLPIEWEALGKIYIRLLQMHTRNAFFPRANEKLLVAGGVLCFAATQGALQRHNLLSEHKMCK